MRKEEKTILRQIDQDPKSTSLWYTRPCLESNFETLGCHSSPDRRRYNLRFPSGRVLWQNRKFLRQLGIQLNESPCPILDVLLNNPPEEYAEALDKQNLQIIFSADFYAFSRFHIRSKTKKGLGTMPNCNLISLPLFSSLLSLHERP